MLSASLLRSCTRQLTNRYLPAVCRFSTSSPSHIKINDRIPSVTLYENTPSNTVTTDDLCKGRNVVLFGTPGAFTPACSQTHLPGYVKKANELRASGIDDIVCITVNDPFVAAAWSRDQQAGGKVRILADVQGEFARAADLEMDLRSVLGSIRCRRFSMLLRDGVVVELNVEPDGTGLSCSLAEVLAKKLNRNQ